MSESLITLFEAAGETYVQTIDVSTDAVMIRNVDEELVLRIDRSARVFDAEGKQIGNFRLESISNQYHWYYEHKETGEELPCGRHLLDAEVKMVQWLMEKAKVVV